MSCVGVKSFVIVDDFIGVVIFGMFDLVRVVRRVRWVWVLFVVVVVYNLIDVCFNFWCM